MAERQAALATRAAMPLVATVTRMRAAATAGATAATAAGTAAALDLVFVIDGAKADHYLNGELAESKDFAVLDTSATHMEIGGWMTPENVLDGEIDDVQVFDLKLSNEQIEALPSTRDRTYER